MHPEAVTLPAEDQLRMQQQQPDMAQFEAEFTQQAEVGHTCSVGCEHHHADVHIDHPEDHLNELTEVHTETHGHEDQHGHTEHEGHVHGPGCGYVEHEQAHGHIDHHVHSESCGHLHHGEAKEHVDHGHEDSHNNHHEAQHIHHAGCGHVSHERAERHMDKDHVHSANCGHLHHHEADAHVDHAEKPKHEAHDHSYTSEHIHGPGCGHVGFERAHEHADRAEYHEHHHIYEAPKSEESKRHAVHDTEVIHAQEHDADTVRQQAEPQAEVIHEHSTRAVKLEQRAIQSVELETLVRPELVEATAHEEQRQRQIIESVETFAGDAAVPAAQIVERPPDGAIAAVQSEVPPTITLESVSEPTSETLQTVAETESVQEASSSEQLDDVPELYEASAVSEELPATTEVYSDATETIITPELAATEVVEAEPDNVVSNEMMEATTSLRAYEAAPLVTPNEVQEKPSVPVVELPQIVEHGDTLVAIENIADVIVEQIQAVTTEIAASDPERQESAQTTITKLRANLTNNAPGESLPPQVHREFVELLRQLGFASPERTLGMYLSQYGYYFLDDMLLRLFELLNESASYEAFKLYVPTLATRQTQASDSRVVGRFALRLLTVAQSIARLNNTVPQLALRSDFGRSI